MASYLILFLLLIQGTVLQHVWGVTLSPCGTDRKAEVRQGMTDNFNCIGLTSGGQVDWYQDWKSQELFAGSCKAGQCNQAQLGAAFTPGRLSATVSKMVIDPSEVSNTSVIGAGTLICKDFDTSTEDSCQTDYIVAAEGSCTVQPGTGSSRYKAQASCSIQPGASSARNRYRCEWHRKTGSLELMINNKTLTASNYQTGCVVTDPLPTTTGRYTYTATLIPGRNKYTAGTLDITSPSAPSVSPNCGGDNYIPENTAVSCTCTTSNIGQPAGRLQWVRGTTNTTSGGYGDSSFTVSQNLRRDDHNTTLFRCKVNWATDISGAQIKFKVGYPPTTVSLGLNNVRDNRTVDEHQTTTFRCEYSDGRPSSNVTLVNTFNDSVLARGEGSLTHMVTARCEDGGSYVCTADNRMGSSVTSRARSLFVRCSPRGEYDVGEVNFISEPVSVTFDVIAYPAPDQVTFRYIGPMANDTGAVDVKDSEIQLTGECRPKTGVIYLSTCTVQVLNVTTATAAGFYQVTVVNTQDSGRFRLQVKYKAPVPEPQDEGTNAGAIAGGVVGGLVVLALVIVVVVLVVRRRKDADKQKLNTSAAAPFNGGHAGHHGEFDNPAHQADPEQPELSSSSTTPVTGPPPPPPPSSSTADTIQPPTELYALVNKPKKTGATAAAAEAATPEAVYTQVDKTKKKKKKDAAPPAPKTKSPAKPKTRKPKKGAEAHIYGNMDTKAENKSESPIAVPMECTQESTGREVNKDGLLYSSVDFSGVTTPSSHPVFKSTSGEQGVIYSDVDFAKIADPQE